MAPFPDSCTAVLPMSAQEYFVERDSAPFRALMSEVLDLGEVDWTDSWKEGRKSYHKLVTRPDYEKWVPKIGRKYVKPDDLDFYDIIEYDPDQLSEPPYRLNVTSELQLLGDKLEARRSIVIEAIDATHCRHSVTGDVKVRMFGIGRLAEKGVIDSTVKTFKQLPYVLDRYLAVRNDMLKSERGRAALLEGRPPHLDDIDARMYATLQAPYPRATVDVDAAESSSPGDSSSSSDEDEARAPRDTPASAPTLRRSDTVYHDPDSKLARSESLLADSPTKAKGKGRLERSDTMYYDVGEQIFDEDALWVPEEVASDDEHPEKMQRISSTRAALKRDRRRMRKAMHKLRARSRSFIVSDLGIDVNKRKAERAERAAHREVNVEDSSKQSKWNSQREQWKEFWRGTKVQSVPVPNLGGRLMQLITFGQLTGWVDMRRNQDDSVRSNTSVHAASASLGELSDTELETPISAFSQVENDSGSQSKRVRRRDKFLTALKDGLKLSK